MKEKDLDRAACRETTTAVLLTDRNTQDALVLDNRNILIGLAMKKYVRDKTGKQLRLCIQLIKPQSKQNYLIALCNNKNNSKD